MNLWHILILWLGLPPSIMLSTALREESSQTNVILQYKLLASIVSTDFSVI